MILKSNILIKVQLPDAAANQNVKVSILKQIQYLMQIII